MGLAEVTMKHAEMGIKTSTCMLEVNSQKYFVRRILEHSNSAEVSVGVMMHFGQHGLLLGRFRAVKVVDAMMVVKEPTRLPSLRYLQTILMAHFRDPSYSYGRDRGAGGL